MLAYIKETSLLCWHRCHSHRHKMQHAVCWNAGGGVVSAMKALAQTHGESQSPPMIPGCRCVRSLSCCWVHWIGSRSFALALHLVYAVRKCQAADHLASAIARPANANAEHVS